MERGAKGVREPWEETDDNGTVVFAVVQTVSEGCYHSTWRVDFNAIALGE